MQERQPLKSGIEFDVFTGWRKVMACCGRAGYCRYAKRKYQRRMRRLARRECRETGIVLALLILLVPAAAQAAEPYVKIDGKGSGTVITCPDGQARILTCAHGYAKVGEEVRLKFNNINRWLTGTVVAIDWDRDLALLDFQRAVQFTPAPLAQACPVSGSVQMVGFGKDVFANRTTKIKGGVQTTIGYKSQNMDATKVRDLICVEAVGRSGDSGGALMVKGQLVGVVIAKSKDAFAVPVEQIHEFLGEQ